MSNRTVLLSIDIESAFTSFGDFGPGIWQSTVSKSLDDRAASFWEDMGGTWSEELLLGPVIVGTVKDLDQLYQEVFTRDELFSIDTGFYFDNDSQIVYIKFLNYQPWYMREFLDYGLSLLMIDSAQWDDDIHMANQCYIDDVFAEPRVIEGSFSYSQQASDLDQNRATFNDCQISIINADGAYDHLREQTIGRGMDVYYSSLPDTEYASSLKDFVMVFSGRVKAVSFTSDSATITGGDVVSEWQNTVSDDKLTLNEYPLMNPDQEGQYKSFIFGRVFGVPCVNVSAEKPHGDNKLWNINSVYNGESQIVALYDGDADDYEPIDPSKYDYFPDSGDIKLKKDPKGDLRADMIGPPVISPITGLDSYTAVDTALYILAQFQGLEYIESFFDVDDIKKTRNLSGDVGIFIDGEHPLQVKDFLDKVLSGDNVRLYQKPVKDDENIPRIKISMRGLGVDIFAPRTTIKSEDLLQLPLPWNFDEASHFTSISVRYNESVFNGTFNHYRDDSLRLKAYENTPIIFEYVYQTYLNNRSQIIDKALERYNEGILAQYRVKGTSGKELEFALLDYVEYTHGRIGGKEIIPLALWRVINIDIINRSFELGLVRENYVNPVIPFTGDTNGPYIMFNDDLNANLRGDFI